jgi:RecJ-like exonuclease
MSSCIICGSSVDGRICDLHQEDVVFRFHGTQANQLTVDRYYRGTVDGYAEFGVFVDIGDSVTGLLHKSELDQRLDSLDWEPGDDVFVEVKNVRDNGNVDLGWSIRQDESAFRGTLIDDPDAGTERLVEDDDGSTEEAGETDGGRTSMTVGPSSVEGSAPASDATASTGGEAETGGAPADDDASSESTATEGVPPDPDPEQVTVDSLPDHVGEWARIEGEIASARQTSGPTVFELRDETGTVDCAAFEEAGVRAYPEVEGGDVVRIEGEVERRRGELQVETEDLVLLEDDERAAVTERMDEALLQRARPEAVDPVAPDAAVESTLAELREAATAIRRAVLEGRPVVVRHSATADGYVGSVAIERATLPLIRDHHQAADATYHYFDRRPLEGSVYDMDDATQDVTTMLSDRERHDEQLPLFVFVAAAGTDESVDGLDLLDVYNAQRVVVDEQVDDTVAGAVDVLATPTENSTTATALATTVAAHVNTDVRDDLRHLPAISFWEETPEAYADIASAAGYDAEATREMREAVTLEAYYQSYEDKRQLVTDLLFEADGGVAGHVSEQFQERTEAEVETAEANAEHRTVGGHTVLVLDTEAYTHQYEFPPDRLLLDELHRRHRDDVDAVVGIGTDTAFVRTGSDVDVRAVVERAREDAPAAGLDARGAREGRVEFLSGEREAARDALLSALAEPL